MLFSLTQYLLMFVVALVSVLVYLVWYACENLIILNINFQQTTHPRS
jgi:hypothetical protein